MYATGAVLRRTRRLLKGHHLSTQTRAPVRTTLYVPLPTVGAYRRLWYGAKAGLQHTGHCNQARLQGEHLRSYKNSVAR